MICDFCSADIGDGKHTERAISFVDVAAAKLGVVAVSDGDWLSCDECHALIEQGAWPALARRCAEGFVRKYGGARTVDQILPHFTDLHDQFRRARL